MAKCDSSKEAFQGNNIVMKTRFLSEKTLKELSKSLQYNFKKVYLLELALTHSSLIGQDNQNRKSNERLEFLGDRVLGIVIADILLDRVPEENEGDIARRFTALVRMETLGCIAERLKLGKYILSYANNFDFTNTSAGITIYT